MTTSTSTQKQNETGQAAATIDDAYANILAAARSTSTRTAFFAKVLRGIGEAFTSPYAAICLRSGAEVFDDDCHFGPTDPAFWKPSLQLFLTESLSIGHARIRLLNAKRGDRIIAFVSSPLHDANGNVIGAMAMVIPQLKDLSGSQDLSVVESLARFTSFTADQVEGNQKTQTSDLNSAMGRLGAHPTPESLAFALTNSLRNKLGCEQVSLGLIESRKARILSISGLDHVSERSSGVRCLKAAMEECYDADKPVTCQQSKKWSNAEAESNYYLHAQWRAATHGDNVASIPLRNDGIPAAVLSIRMRGEQAISPEQLEEIHAKIEPFVPALLMARKASRSVIGHALDSTRGVAKTLTHPGHVATKVLAAVVTVSALWFVFGTMNYALTVPCTVMPGSVRHVSSPIDGILLETHVSDGDIVRAGDVLCRIDASELEQQRAELLAQITVHEREQDRAMAGNEPAAAQLALASRNLTRTQLDIVQHRIDQTFVRAPIDGIVVAGDLEKWVGGVLERGRPLFQVAPVGEWVLELTLPEADIEEVEAGLSGEFCSQARPDESQAFCIDRVRLTAESRDMENVFVAEADTQLSYDWMKPGMEGTARIEVGRRPVWWVVLHRAIDHVRMAFWL